VASRLRTGKFITFLQCIHVPVVYMAGDVMILMRANTFRGPLEGVDPENRDFFGPGNGSERSECHLGPTKSTV
jgi:hypothetical protein